MKPTKRLLAVAALLTGAVAYFASAGFARPVESSEYTYYSDASLSNQVGTREFTCTGKNIYTGQVTPYYVVQHESCN